MATTVQWARSVCAGLLLLLTCGASISLQAAEQRYDYDPLGRLVRAVGEGLANEYVYDAAGNLLRVTAGTAQPPVISSGNLGDFPVNAYRNVSVSGTSLVGAAISASHIGIVLSNVYATTTGASFRVAVRPGTPLGTHQINFVSASGSVSVAMNVVPGLAVAFEPMPMAVPPDNVARQFTARLSAPAAEPIVFTLGTAAPSIARTSASQISFAVGQSTANIGVIGVTAGSTLLTLNHASLVDPADAMVTVRAGAGTQVYLSAPVGITRGVPFAVAPATHTLSRPVGITRGVPFARSPTTLVVTPPVGISKP